MKKIKNNSTKKKKNDNLSKKRTKKFKNIK